jgi:hypothetical protein
MRLAAVSTSNAVFGVLHFQAAHPRFVKERLKKSFASRPVLPNLAKGRPMRKPTKEQKRDIRVIASKRDEDIGFPTLLPFSTGTEPKSASSIGQRRSP